MQINVHYIEKSMFLFKKSSVKYEQLKCLFTEININE